MAYKVCILLGLRLDYYMSVIMKQFLHGNEFLSNFAGIDLIFEQSDSGSL